MGLIERQAEPQLKVVEERGITHSDTGIFLFGSGCNVPSDCVTKRAGWVDKSTCRLYFRDDLEEEDSADIIIPRDDNSINDGGMVATSSGGNCHKVTMQRR